MAKPYYLYKKSSGYYYAEILLSDGSYSVRKSTGTRDKKEAEKIVMSWVVNGNIPQRINGKTDDVTSVDKISLMNALNVVDFSESDIRKIIDILEKRNFLQSAVIKGTPGCIPIEGYLDEFWDFDRSSYVMEKLNKGQSIHRDYCNLMKTRIKTYWLPRLKGRVVGDVTRKDVNGIFFDPSVAHLSGKTINSIVSALTIPLKHAYLNGLTVNNCYDGIIKCSVKESKRKILTMEVAMKLFSDGLWENDMAKFANMLAFYTGMRMGEIAALRCEDIGSDRIYIKHSWSKYEGLKETKTNECREIKIPSKLRDSLLLLARLNPHKEGEKSFIFYGLKPGKPTDPGNWRKYLQRALKSIGYSNPEEICFHAWRHLWCSRVSDIIEDKRIVMTGSGHKTEVMLNHYSEHVEKERALDKLQEATDMLFLPVLDKAD